jgi:predicted nucleic acid-binding Zn ribbon protein
MPEPRSFTHLGDIRLATTGPLRILQAWSRVVGAPLAGRARPCAWYDGVLTLSVDEPRWRATLEALAPALREEINAWLGSEVVREIRVQGRRAGEE